MGATGRRAHPAVAVRCCESRPRQPGHGHALDIAAADGSLTLWRRNQKPNQQRIVSPHSMSIMNPGTRNVLGIDMAALEKGTRCIVWPQQWSGIGIGAPNQQWELRLVGGPSGGAGGGAAAAPVAAALSEFPTTCEHSSSARCGPFVS